MRALVLCPTTNRPGRHDASGAFIPKANAFCRIHGLGLPTFFDNPESDARQGSAGDIALENQVIGLINAAPRPIEVFAYFGHGLADGLNSLGFRGEADTRQLAQALGAVASSDLVVLLYACSAANGFAQQLVAGLRSAGCASPRVYAHTTAAHTTANPNLKVFPEDRFVVQPDSRHWRRWREALHDTSLWAVFPWLTQAQLDEVLEMPTSEINAFLQVGSGGPVRARRR